MELKMRQISLIALLLLGACRAAPGFPVDTPTPSAPGESECNWELAYPTEEAIIEWPSLLPIEIETVLPGDELEITAFGGYLRWDDACGELIDESARQFRIFIDGEPIGNISCYVNVCRVRITIPIDTLPGMHSLSVEGGSSLDLEIVDR